MSQWQPEEDELLRQLFRAGKTFGEMPPFFKGRSRNACLGRCQRLGLERVTPPRCHKRSVKVAAPKVRKPVVMLADPALSERVPTINLTDDHCRWPVGDPGEPDFAHCGRKPRPGSPYCETHHAVAYMPSSARPAGSNTFVQRKYAA
jgi:GcrA cell cycle regulator